MWGSTPGCRLVSSSPRRPILVLPRASSPLAWPWFSSWLLLFCGCLRRAPWFCLRPGSYSCGDRVVPGVRRGRGWLFVGGANSGVAGLLVLGPPWVVFLVPLLISSPGSRVSSPFGTAPVLSFRVVAFLLDSPLAPGRSCSPMVSPDSLGCTSSLGYPGLWYVPPRAPRRKSVKLLDS